MTSNSIMNSSRKHNLLGSTGLLACVLMLSGCAGGASQGQADVIDMRSEPILSTDLESVNGTYGAGCTDRTGAWSLSLAFGAVLDNEELSVVLNDDACVLTLTELRTDAMDAIVADPAIVLSTAYKLNPSEFDDPVAFYANAKLNSVSFADDFTLTVLYSDDARNATGGNTASFESTQSSSAQDWASAPDYTIDPSGIALLTDTDQIVQSATGSIPLTAGMVTGQYYVVLDDSGLITYADIDAAYRAAVAVAITSTVPAAAFDLVGEDLSVAVHRTLIIANIESGVPSYQTFDITFNPAM